MGVAGDEDLLLESHEHFYQDADSEGFACAWHPKDQSERISLERPLDAGKLVLVERVGLPNQILDLILRGRWKQFRRFI